jgi:hypothetical protein
MKIKPLFLFSLMSILFYTPLMTMENSAAGTKKEIMPAKIKQASERIQQHLQQCRQFLEDYAKSNTELVLAKFDVFARSLLGIYQAGEGLIEEDIHPIIDAACFAAERHQSQLRKSTPETSYIIHPIGVANDVMVVGRVRDADIIIAALLHDTVEDTNTSFEEILHFFGPRVESFIRELTDDKSLPKEERKRLQIVNAAHKSAGAAQIKLADKLYNLNDLLQSPPSDWSQERIEAYFKWAQSVVDHLPWVNAPLKQAVDHTIQRYWQQK